MKIYRVQKENGNGPFVGGLSDRLAILNHLDIFSSQPNHPAPGRDGFEPDDKYGGYAYCKVFGCLSLKRLQSWFNPYKVIKDDDDFIKLSVLQKDKKTLIDNNFFIMVYDCPDEYVQIGKSNTQVMFDYTEAEIIYKLPIEKLYEL